VSEEKLFGRIPIKWVPKLEQDVGVPVFGPGILEKPEPMTDERLQQIRNGRYSPPGISRIAVDELLAEVDRLRADLKEIKEQILVGKRVAATDDTRKALEWCLLLIDARGSR